jgi:ERCC4-type nuclease
MAVSVLSVLVDSREPEWCQKLTFGGAPTSVSFLDAGDVLAICDDAVIAIERKEASDFLNTMAAGRLFPQLAKLRELSQWAYLVIVGSIVPGANGTCSVEGRQTNWNWSSIQGAIVTAQEMGVVVVEVTHDTEYESTVLRLCNRDRAPLRIHPPRDAAIVSDAEAILGALPGVGAERASALVKYSGSPAWAITYLTDDSGLGERVPGIGEGVKRRIRKALGLEDWQTLCVIAKETGNPVAREQKVMEKVS